MKNQTLKLFGLTKQEIEDKLSELGLLPSVKTYVKEKYEDAFLYIDEKKEDGTFEGEIKKIVNCFARYIYAYEDVSLYERLYEVLRLRNKTICLMEQGTGGIITSNLVAFDGAEQIVRASYVMPSIRAMQEHFDLSPFKFTVNHGVCGEIAFDIASFMRSRIAADLYVVSLSTLAEGNNLYYNDNRIISYVAIGSEDGVKIIKQEADGKKRDQMNQLAKTICFRIINQLK